MNIGQIIRQAREKKGISIDELADQVDRSKTALSELERYGKMPNFDTACRICEVLEIDIVWLWHSVRDDYMLKLRTRQENINSRVKEEKNIQRGDG